MLEEQDIQKQDEARKRLDELLSAAARFTALRSAPAVKPAATDVAVPHPTAPQHGKSPHAFVHQETPLSPSQRERDRKAAEHQTKATTRKPAVIQRGREEEVASFRSQFGTMLGEPDEQEESAREEPQEKVHAGAAVSDDLKRQVEELKALVEQLQSDVDKTTANVEHLAAAELKATTAAPVPLNDECGDSEDSPLASESIVRHPTSGALEARAVRVEDATTPSASDSLMLRAAVGENGVPALRNVNLAALIAWLGSDADNDTVLIKIDGTVRWGALQKIDVVTDVEIDGSDWVFHRSTIGVLTVQEKADLTIEGTTCVV